MILLLLLESHLLSVPPPEIVTSSIVRTLRNFRPVPASTPASRKLSNRSNNESFVLANRPYADLLG